MPVAPQPLGHCKNHECKSPHCPTKHYATCILAFLYSCLMPHPSGSKLLTNPHVIPHPTPIDYYDPTAVSSEVCDSHVLLLQYHDKCCTASHAILTRLQFQYRAPDSIDVPGITLALRKPRRSCSALKSPAVVQGNTQEIPECVLTSDDEKHVR